MNLFQKSESIKAGLRKGFEDGNSKIAERRCYGYKTAPDSILTIHPEEAAVVIRIFVQYKDGISLEKIATGLEQQGVFSPTGKPKWNREAIDRLRSNEKYTGRMLLQKPLAPALSKLRIMASWIGISTPTPMRPLFRMNCLMRCSKKSTAAAGKMKKIIDIGGCVWYPISEVR